MRFERSIYIYSIVFILFLMSSDTIGQDIAFDQYMKSPTYLNPALTGVMSGNYRLTSTYHNQWSGQLETGINAFILGGDVRFERESRDNKKDVFGIGLTFLNDEYSAFNLSTKTLTVNGAYHKLLNPKTHQYLGVGFQLGINQKNLNYEHLNFEDQFNQVDAYSNVSEEYLPKNNFGYLDYSTGIFYSGELSEKVHANLGISYFHLANANISYYSDVRNPVSSLEQESNLNAKLNVHTAATIQLSNQLELIPDLLYQKQGAHQNLVFGSKMRIAINYEEINNSLSIGFRAKLSKNSSDSNLSNIIVLTDYKHKNMVFGFSYNLMIKPLIIDQLALNIFEFSINYTGQYDTDQYHCPEF